MLVLALVPSGETIKRQMGLSAGKNCNRKKIKIRREIGKELGEAGRDFRLCVSLIPREEERKLYIVLQRKFCNSIE